MAWRVLNQRVERRHAVGRLALADGSFLQPAKKLLDGVDIAGTIRPLGLVTHNSTAPLHSLSVAQSAPEMPLSPERATAN